MADKMTSEEQAEQSSDKKRALIDARFRRLTNMSIKTIDESCGYFAFGLPGFKYDDFNSAGYLSLHKILRLFETGRFSTFRDLRFSGFMLGGNIEIGRDLYERAAIDYPMILERRLNHVGRTSLSVSQRLFESESDLFLASRIWMAVNVDLDTKKPKPLPAVFQDDFGKNAAISKTPPKLIQQFKTVPERSFTNSITVRMSDIDLNGHSTQASYVLYAVECSECAMIAKFYRNVHEGALAHRIGILFLNETTIGDELLVITWEDDVNPLIARFLIQKAAGVKQDVCQVEIEYHDDVENIPSHL